MKHVIDDSTPLWPDGQILEAECSIKSGSKNPHGPWKIPRVTMKVNVSGMTRKDIIPDLMSSWKIKRQRCRETMSRDDALKAMQTVVSWRDVGKVAQTPIDIDAAFRARFADMSPEQQAEHIAALERLQKSGFGK